MKGFTLPTSNTTTNGSFSNLITQTSANTNTIVQAPLMFVRGSYVDPGGYLDAAGSYGYYREPETRRNGMGIAGFVLGIIAIPFAVLM